MTGAMKLSTLLSIAAWGCTQAATSGRTHPIEGVIQMLKGLEHTAEEEGKSEELLFQKFEYWCKSSEKTLQDAVTKEKAGIDELTDTVSAKTEELASLGEQIKALEDQLAQISQADTQAAAQRSAENALYTEANTAFTETITAVNSAIEALKASGESGASLLQAQKRVREALPLAGAMATLAQRQMLTSFASGSEAPGIKAAGDHDAHVQKYAFKSTNIIEILKELKAKFEEEQLEATKGETNAANAYALQDKASKAAAAAATESKTTKESEQTAATTALNTAKASLLELQGDLAADSDTLLATRKQCSIKRTEWAERVKTRAQEIQALKSAQAILAKVGGVRTEAPTNPVPPTSPVTAAFVQGPKGSTLVSKEQNPKLRAVELLRAEAKATHSKALERLAQEVSVRVLNGPFDEVNNMIQKMIFQLMKEQTDEDNHKAWCDLELSKTNASLTNKAERLGELKAQIDEAIAATQLLGLAVKEAQEMVSEIDAHVAEATDIREVGKQENAQALKDSQDAQTAINQAIAVLQEFYKSSGMIAKQPYELVQRGVELPDEPSTWEASYTGVADPANQPDGIVTLLKKVSSDFAKMEGETRAQEQTDQKAYQEEMKACAIEKARQNTIITVKGQEQQRQIEKTASLGSTHKHISSEHEATEQYMKDLQPACVQGDSTYEDRKEARASEIEALRQAQGILSDAFKEAAAEEPPAEESLLAKRAPMRLRGQHRLAV